MRPSRALALLCLCALLAGCTMGGGDGAGTTTTGAMTGTGTPTATASPPAKAPFRVLETGTSSGIETTGFEGRTYTSQSAWEAFWAQHKSKTSEPGTPPAVDFSREMVVALFLGQKPSSGHAIEVANATATASRLTVHYVTTQPGDSCGTLAVITEPFQLVAVVADRSLAVEFVRDAERVHTC